MPYRSFRLTLPQPVSYHLRRDLRILFRELADILAQLHAPLGLHFHNIGLLLDRKLIEECGRLQVPGRPRLYRTTKQFLRAFHLTSLDDLPELPDLGGEGQMRIGEDGQIMDPADTAEITGADTPETAGAMEEEAP